MKKISLILFLSSSFLAFGDPEIGLFKPERSDPAIMDSIVVDPVVFAGDIGLPRNYNLLPRAQRRQIVYEVGDRYFRNQAYEEALFWLLVATKRGLPEAKYKLAILYRDVFPELSTVNQIFNLFLQAARAGVVEAQQEIAYIYLGVDLDSPFKNFANLKKAIEWYTRLADSGSPEAQYNLARILYNQGNKEAAFQRYLEAANNGLGLAQLRVGRMLELGDGVTQNFVQAILWYRKAVVSYEVHAKYRLSMMYQEGRGVNRDVKKATRLRNEAILAQRNLRHLTGENFNDETYINVRAAVDNMHRENAELIDVDVIRIKSDSTRATDLSTFLNARQAENNKKPFMDSYPSPVMYEAHQRGDLFYRVKSGDLSREEIYDATIALKAAERKVHRVSLSPEETAMYNTLIGNFYRSGLIQFIDPRFEGADRMAIMFFKEAIGRHMWSNGTAEYWMGLMHEFGRGVDKNEAKAIEFYERSIQNFYATYDRYKLATEFSELDSAPPPRTHPLHSIGLAEAYYRLAKIHESRFVEDKNQVINFHSRVVQRDIMSYYKEAARLGLAAAQYRLAEIYMEGLFNTTRNVEEAIYWLRRVIFQSVNIQTHRIYELYVTSARYQLDLERLMKAQFYLAHILAERGNAEAAFNLANMYVEGRGVARDIDRAIYWYEQSMAKDYVDAYVELARVYQEGRGIAQDLKKAERLYKEATVRGSAEAPYLQALIYEERILSDNTLSAARKNELLQEILRLYTLSANRGFVSAQISAAKMYEEGRGVSQDLNKTLAFYEKARFQGSKEAQENFDRLVNNVPGKRCARAMLSVVN